ncbi:MAG: signal peptidase I [bacterium]|nr:signal peptidase I [bacterium]MCX7917007.1 signal peptidase I [bacterium]MDW8164149.1 signal peptidase I [Candidatus Omnitrophota bacterium]
MEKKRNLKIEAFNWFKSLFWTIIIVLFIRTFFVGNFKIPTTSMVPTLKVGDRLLSNNIIYKIRSPKRGEVIIFRPPHDPKRDFVKRLIGLPGEKVIIKEGKIYINGKEIKDPKINCRYYYSIGIYGVGEEVEVPENSYYVLGDNSINSSDSREWGFVPKKNLIGKALFIYWPPWRMGFIK